MGLLQRQQQHQQEQEQQLRSITSQQQQQHGAAPAGSSRRTSEEEQHRSNTIQQQHEAAPAGSPRRTSEQDQQPRQQPPRHHSHPGDTLEDAHVVHLSAPAGDVDVTVGEDEPAKRAVEARISDIEVALEHPAHPVKEYFAKWRGGIDTRVPVPSARGVLVSWVGAFLGILVVSVTDHFLWRDHGFSLLIGSFGASAVLLYGVPESKLSQPRNLIGGQIVSAIVGVCARLALNKVQWLANAIGMSLALVAMQLTQTTHPPGGATALIACSMATLPPWSGFQMVVAVALGSVELMAVAIIVTNLHADRAYPTFWW